jgi:hypothetical protein
MISFLSSHIRKFLLVAILLVIINVIHGQSVQPYIGIHGGINFSQTILLGQNQGIVTLLNGEKSPERKYNSIFKNFGNQVGFSIYLKLNDHWSIGFLPELAKYSYGYNSLMKFNNNQGDTVLSIENTSKTNINYFNFPLILQYQYKIQKISPYVFFGASYGILRNAQHTVNVNSTQTIDGNVLEFNESSTDNYTTEYIHSKINLLGGVGVVRDFTLFHLAIDLSYWVGLNNIVNESGRYSTQTISGTTYDVPDDIRLNHIVVNLSVIFPINKSEGKKGSLDCVIHKSKK